MHSSGKEGGGPAGRAGALGLSLIEVPVNAAALGTLLDGPQSLIELREASEAPATTVRRHLGVLADLGAVEKRRDGTFPGTAQYELTPSGRQLAGVARTVGRWLASAPEGPLELRTPSGKNTVKALVDGWSTSMMRALAARPLSLTDLDRLIVDVSYPSLERRLAAMRQLQLVQRTRGRNGSALHAVTDWLRRAVMPLVAAARWEAIHAPEVAARVTNRDIETFFLLSLPLLRMSSEVNGSCRLAVEFSNAQTQRYAGAVVTIESGRVVSCVSRLTADVSAWATGSAADWMPAVERGDHSRLELGGDRELATSVLDGMHAMLYQQEAGRR
jgi:DNA-binding HxlR family transcriptional regulator